MTQRPWRNRLHRRFCRPGQNGAEKSSARGYEASPVFCFFLTILTAGLVAVLTLFLIGSKLRPAVAVAAETQLREKIISAAETALSEELSRNPVEHPLVSVKRDSQGTITGLSTDVSAVHHLHNRLTPHILHSLNQVRTEKVSLPADRVFHRDFLREHGPNIRMRIQTFGPVSVEPKSDFSSGGVDRTIHRVWMEVSVPVTVLLPCGQEVYFIRSKILAAETVIAGKMSDCKNKLT